MKPSGKRTSMIRLLMAASLCVGVPASASLPLVIVVHPSNPLAALTSADVMRLFTGKSKTFPGAGPAIPVGLKDGLQEKQTFDGQVLNKTSNQVRAFWAQQIFTGRGTPPREFETPAALKAHIAAHPEAVGYLGAADADGSVKIVLTLP